MSNQTPPAKRNLPSTGPQGHDAIVIAIQGLTQEMAKMNQSLERLDVVDKRLSDVEKVVRTLTEEMGEIEPRELAANMQRINTAIFGNQDLKVPSLRDDIKGIRDEVAVVMTTYDRVKWAATILGISNITQFIYWAKVFLGIGGGTP